MNAPNPRETAFKALMTIETEKSYSNITLKKYLPQTMTQQDKNLASALVYGVLSRKLTLDYIISQFSSVPLKKMSQSVINILRMGIYQIMYMDKIPHSAAVNESVKLAKKHTNKGAYGFVNGVLRNYLRNTNIAYPKDAIENISVTQSIPMWLVKRWTDEFGEGFTRELAKAFNTSPEVTLRVNTLKTTPDKLCDALNNQGTDAFVSDVYENAVFAKGFDIHASRLYNNGDFIVQDISAMMAAKVLNPQPGQTVIDVCAAPGGKTTHIAQLMNNEGTVFAFDIHEHKIKIINSNAKRMGIDIIQTCCRDASQTFDALIGKADRVLADVPCSGLGILRRKPEIKWDKTAEDIEQISKIQAGILSASAKYLKSGGELVYSTCSIEKQENEDVFNEFLKQNPDFERVDITQLLPEQLRKDTCKNGYVTFYPNTDGIDGFFISKLRKR